MLQLRVNDPVLRQQLQRGPIRFAAQVFLVMVGAMAILTAIVDVFLGDATIAAAFRLVSPALATSAVVTWLLWRGSRERPSPPGAA